MKIKVLIFIDHDIVCRHFLMSGALRPLVDKADVRFVFPNDGNKRVTIDPAPLTFGAPVARLPVNPERVQQWRWVLFADQLQFRWGRFEREVRRIRWRFLGWKAASLLTIAGLPPIRPFFRRWIRWRLARTPYGELTALIDRERPDVILHPSVLEGLFLNDLVEESRARGIPFVVVMNSWDNPSTKRAVVCQPDWVLVWGQQTQAHGVRFMKVPPERAIPFGAAQFDVFKKEPQQSRRALATAHGIDPLKRLIVFAGSSAQTDEFATLTALDAAIENGQLGNASIIYRPHPWGKGGRGGERIADAQWKHVVVHLPTRDYISAIASGRKQRTLPDYRDTHDLLAAADVVVSPLSTILLEAVLHAKPVVVFAPTGEARSDILQNRLPMLHFEEFLKLPGICYAEDTEELQTTLARLIDPSIGEAIGQRLAREAEQFVAPFDRPWGDRLVEFLGTIVAQGKPASVRAADGALRTLTPAPGE